MTLTIKGTKLTSDNHVAFIEPSEPKLNVEGLIAALQSKGNLTEAVYELAGKHEYTDVAPLLMFFFEELQLRERRNAQLSRIRTYLSAQHDNMDNEDVKWKVLCKNIVNTIEGMVS